MKTISWSKSKLVLLGSVLFLSSFFFGGQASAIGCTWTASTSQNISSLNNWDNGSGTACNAGQFAQLLRFDGAVTSTNANFDADVLTGNITFQNAYSGTVGINSNITVTSTGSFTVGAGLFNMLNLGSTLSVVNFNVSSSNSLIFTTGTINIGSNFFATTTFSASSGAVVNFTSTTANQTVGGPGNITFDTLNITSGANTVTLNSSVTTTGAITVANGNTFDLGAYNLITAGHINNSGTITQSAGTVTMTGNKNLGGSGNTTFYNLLTSGMVALSGNVTTTNNLTVTGANFSGQNGTDDYYLVVGGNISVSQSFQFNSVYGRLHLTLTSSTASFTNSGNSQIQIWTLTIPSLATTTLVGSGDSKTFDVYSTTTVAGILNVGDGTILHLHGDGSAALAVSGTLNTNTSTIVFNGNSQIVPAATYYNLQFIGSGTDTFGGSVTTTNLTVNYTSLTVDLGSNNLVVLGNLTNTAGTITQSVGTVTMSSSSANFGGAGNTTVFNLLITGTTTLQGTVTSTGVLTITGVLNATSTDLNLSGSGTPFVNNGTFNASTGYVTYFGTSNIATNTTFYNLRSSGTQSLNGNLTVTKNFLVVAGASVTQSTGTLSMSGSGAGLGGAGNTTLYNLTVASTSFAGNVTTTNRLTVNGLLTADSRTLILSATGTPFVISPSGSFDYGTSNITYTGSNVIFASTTYYNLTLNSSVSSSMAATTTVMNTLTIGGGALYESHDTDFLILLATGTPLSNGSGARFSTTSQRVNLKYGGSEVNVAGGTFHNLTIDSASSTLIGDITVSNLLVVNSGKVLNGSSYTITLSVAGSTPLVLAGTFTAASSTVSYTGATAALAETTYATLTLGTGSYTLAGTYATSTVAMTNNGTLTVATGKSVIISSGSYTNNATTTLADTGKVLKSATGGLTDTSYISGTANGTGNTISVSITDHAANLLAGTIETTTVSITGSNFSDPETVTLTETGAATGIFSGSILFNIANSASVNSKTDVSGNGTLTLTYKNDYGTLAGTGTSVSYTGSSFSSGGGAGGGSSPSVSPTTPAVTVSTGSQTTSQTITLNLAATNVTQVAISEDPGFAGASWDTYTPTKSFTLSKGAGEKTIYVKFRSASGGVTAAYSVKVTLKSGYVAAPVTATTPVASVAPTAVTQFEVTNPDSKVVITPVKTLVYKPNSVVKYTYSYKNETAKTVKVKIVRSVVDVKGKVVHKVTGSASITKGKTFKFNASSLLSKKVTEGNYTVKVQVLDFKTGTSIDENSFDVTVKKPAPVVKKPVVKKPVVKKPVVKKPVVKATVKAPVKTVAKPVVKKK